MEHQDQKKSNQQGAAVTFTVTFAIILKALTRRPTSQIGYYHVKFYRFASQILVFQSKLLFIVSSGVF